MRGVGCPASRFDVDSEHSEFIFGELLCSNLTRANRAQNTNCLVSRVSDITRRPPRMGGL